MKKIILSLMLLASLRAKSQIVDTTIKSITAVKLQPFVVQINYPKRDTITHLGIEPVGGVLTKSVTLKYILIANGKNIYEGNNQIIAGAEYEAWNDDLYPFVIIAQRLGYTLKNN
jgi:hypothetical protein